MRYSCRVRSGLDTIYFFYSVVINTALYLICAFTYPLLKKKITLPLMTKMLNDN